MAHYQINSFGMRLVEVKWRKSAHQAVNAKPAFSKVADQMMEAIDKTFQSQGRRGGGSWKNLSDHWLKRKIRLGADERKLHFGVRRKSLQTQHLRKSLTKRKAARQHLVIEQDYMILESRVDYAARHQFGHDYTPPRPFIKLTRFDIARAERTIQDHLMSPWKRGGTGVRK